jgi:hypothetical protein
MTWWARDREITWFHPEDRTEIFRFIDDAVAAEL